MHGFALPPRKTECPDCGRTKVTAASITTIGASLHCLACGSTFEAAEPSGYDGALVEDRAVFESSMEPSARHSRIRPSAWTRDNLTRASTVAIAFSLSASCADTEAALQERAVRQPPVSAVRRA